MTAPVSRPATPAAFETAGLGKRYGSAWALQDCTLGVPEGHVTALVGPNGAGKTTLLRLLVGLAKPSAGTLEVLGRVPDGSEEFLAGIGYLAQDVPLYRRLSAADHLALGGRLNRVWDDDGARRRLSGLGVPTDRAVATLSGGQRAQVGLGLALAKRPRLLLLDEPVAALDPLARREFLAALSEAVADGEVSVMLSSHLLHDLERVCDHVILLERVPRADLRGHRDPARLAPHARRPALRSVGGGTGPDRRHGHADAAPDPAARAARRPRARPALGGARDRTRGHHPRLHGERPGRNRGPLGSSGGGAVNHLVWRLHRNQAYFAVAALAALAVILLVTGITMADDYRRALAGCTATQSCFDLHNELFRGDGAIIDLVDLTLIIPLLFGLFWGAPLLAKEFEDGTHNLAWTQGVSRRRWLRVNLTWSLLAAAVWGAALAALVSWWRYPENALGTRFDAFDVQGIVPVAYALFAVALGIAVGSVLRRVLPSLAVTLGVFVSLRATLAVYVRPHYMAPIAKVFSLTSTGGAPPGAWVFSSGLVGPTGTVLSPGIGIDATSIPPACRTVFPGGKGLLGKCLSSHGFRQVITYQPDSRFWPFQWMEAGIFLLLAAALVGFTVWRVLSHDA